MREAVSPPSPVVPPAPEERSLNPFAFGIPVAVVGGILLPLFPPIGLGLGIVGAGICFVGLGGALVRGAAVRVGGWVSTRSGEARGG